MTIGTCLAEPAPLLLQLAAKANAAAQAEADDPTHCSQISDASESALVVVVGFLEDADGFLDSAPGSGEAFLVDGQFFAAGIDGLAKTGDGKIRQLFSDSFQSTPDVLEFTGHGCLGALGR
jgi:hypothetical protein